MPLRRHCSPRTAWTRKQAPGARLSRRCPVRLEGERCSEEYDFLPCVRPRWPGCRSSLLPVRVSPRCMAAAATAKISVHPRPTPIIPPYERRWTTTLPRRTRRRASLVLYVSVSANGPALDVSSGSTSLQDGKPICPDTLFEIGSITKSFTAVMLLKLEAADVLHGLPESGIKERSCGDRCNAPRPSRDTRGVTFVSTLILDE